MSDPVLTAIPAAQDNLQTELKERSGLSGVTVDVGFPVDGITVLQSAAQERIWIGGDVKPGTWTQEWTDSGQFGPAGIDERFTLEVFVYVNKGAAPRTPPTYRSARDRALQMVVELQHELREDITIAGAVQLATITGGDWQEAATETSRAVLIEVDVHCEAFLST